MVRYTVYVSCFIILFQSVFPLTLTTDVERLQVKWKTIFFFFSFATHIHIVSCIVDCLLSTLSFSSLIIPTPIDVFVVFHFDLLVIMNIFFSNPNTRCCLSWTVNVFVLIEPASIDALANLVYVSATL